MFMETLFGNLSLRDMPYLRITESQVNSLCMTVFPDKEFTKSTTEYTLFSDHLSMFFIFYTLSSN